MLLSIFERDGKIAVRSPYHPQFPARARQLGGTWDAGRLIWLFGAREEERVKALCEEVFGPGFKDAASAGPHYLGHRRRLRERVMQSGAEGLPDYELLEVLLFTHDPRRDVKPLAKALIERFGGIPEVLNASRRAVQCRGEHCRRDRPQDRSRVGLTPRACAAALRPGDRFFGEAAR